MFRVSFAMSPSIFSANAIPRVSPDSRFNLRLTHYLLGSDCGLHRNRSTSRLQG